MADFRGSVGYLQLKAANAARQQAIADATTNQIGQDVDVGGKALGVMQQQVQRGQHVEDLDKTLANGLDRAALAGQFGLQRLGLKAAQGPSEKEIAQTELYRAQKANIGHDNDLADRKQTSDEQHRSIMQAALASGADARMIASLSAWMASGAGDLSSTGRPVMNGQVIPPPITVPAGSGPAAAAAHQDPNITPSAQPAAPDAAQNPATAGGYNPQLGTAPDTSQFGARIDKTTRDKLLASNQSAQELAPVLADAIAKFKATKPEDFMGHSTGGTARGVLGLKSGKAPGILDTVGQAMNIIAPEDAQRRQDAVGAVQLFRSKFNQSVSGMTVTEAEDSRLKSALAQLGESIFTGNRDQQIKALEEMERVRGEIYTRNDQALKSGYLPKDFAFKGAALPKSAPQASGGIPGNHPERGGPSIDFSPEARREALFQQKLKELGDPEAAFDAVNKELGEE